MLDTLGVCIGASTLASEAPIVADYVRELGGKPESSVLGFGGKAPAPWAAFVNGSLGQRTYVFRATDASGPPLRQLASATIRLEPFGSQQEPHQTTFNARVAKKMTFARRSLNLSFDVLNVTNSNAITAVTYVSGPAYGRVADILPPRTLRAGVTLDF